MTFRNLYVHIPFCRHKCGYCDFNAYAGMDRLMEGYVAALDRELEAAVARWRFDSLDTVYLGGGTPSLLPAGLAADLLAAVGARFPIAPGAEITLEANPTSTDPERLAVWREGGVNRLSIGLQGFDPRVLAVLERRTDGAQAEAAVAMARNAGFDNLNVDLIYGVPGQSRDSWRETLRRALDLAPEHLSCYCLTFEDGTLLSRRLRTGRLVEVDSDRQHSLLELACQELAAAGYRRYEVSNWSRPGRESCHNRAYWECRPVYGAGAGAHSYLTDGVRAWRWWNVPRPADYIAAAAEPRTDGEELDARLTAAERLMLGLRTADGIVSPPGFEGDLATLEASGLVVRQDQRVAPTPRGMDLHNQIALALL